MTDGAAEHYAALLCWSPIRAYFMIYGVLRETGSYSTVVLGGTANPRSNARALFKAFSLSCLLRVFWTGALKGIVRRTVWCALSLVIVSAYHKCAEGGHRGLIEC